MKNKIKIVLLMFLVIVLTFYSCDKEISMTEADPQPTNANFFIDSEPDGAAIFLNGYNTGKVTPASILGIDPGQYSITLKLEPFLDINIDTVVAEDSRTDIFYNYYEDDRNFGFAFLDDNISYTRYWAGGELLYQWPEVVNLYINDSLTDIMLPDTVKLWPGTYTFRETASEHREGVKVVDILGGRITEVELELQDTSICVDYNSENSDYPTMRSSSIAIDKNGAVWIGNLPGGVAKYEHGRFYYYSPFNTPMISNTIECIAVDENNFKWIGTRKGLIKIDNAENWEIYTTDNSPLPADYITAVAFDYDGNTWISAGNPATRKILAKYDGTNWEIWDSPNNLSIISLAVDQNSMVWAGLDIGLSVFDGSEWQIPANYYSAPYIVRENSIVDLQFDTNGRLWIGIAEINMSGIPGGLYYYEGEEFLNFPLPIDQVDGINIAENGDIWISVYGNELFPASIFNSNPIYRIDNSYNFTPYTRSTLATGTNLFSDAVMHPNGDLWIASRDRGAIKVKFNKINLND